MYNIAEVKNNENTGIIKKSGITKRNIHFYIKEELLNPSIDLKNGYYNFSETDYKQLILIKHLRLLGLSISNIKSLLQNPASAEYYLRIHIGKLEQEMEQLSNNRSTILSILDKLPVSPSFDNLQSITTQEQYPDSLPSFPPYDGKLVNHFLWRTFWEKEHLSEYQQYLWDKINRLTDQRDKNEHYAKVYDYLCQQDQKKINALYKERNMHFNRIAALSEQGVLSYAEEMKQNIHDFIHNQSAVNQWKEHYHSFLVPQMHIFTGEIGKLAQEMCPFYAAYQSNSSKACRYVYEWFLQEDGHTLYQDILFQLDGYVNIDTYNHAELESMNTIFKY